MKNKFWRCVTSGMLTVKERGESMNEIFTRRGMLKGTCGMAAGVALSGVSGWAFGAPPPAGGDPPQNAIAPPDALKRIMAGNGRYAANQPTTKDYSAGRAARASAQYPVAAILSCADSRVSPELVFDQGPGDLFVCRVAGNYVNIDNLASLEYGVAVLGAPLIMVLGHTNCGAVSAVVKNTQKSTPLPGHIFMLVDALQPGVSAAIAQGGDHVLDHAIEANVRYNVERLKGSQPVLAERVKEKKLQVVGAVYELATGKVRLL
jgi:carbonic anhydrase